ncbi:MAG: signal peptidase II [Candidatus Rickettsia vulgarisii]
MRIPFTLRKILLIIRSSSRIIVKLVIIDQVVKWWFISYLKGSSLQVTSFLDIVYIWNYGISFGLFGEYYQYSNRLFMIVNSAIIGYLYYILLKCKTPLSFIGYSFVIGGAIGNLIDRFINGGVFDFIRFHYKDFYFPVFNLADAFISLGVFILLCDFYETKKIVERKKAVQYNDATIQAEVERIRQLDDKKNIN